MKEEGRGRMEEGGRGGREEERRREEGGWIGLGGGSPCGWGGEDGRSLVMTAQHILFAWHILYESGLAKFACVMRSVEVEGGGYSQDSQEYSQDSPQEFSQERSQEHLQQD